MCASICIGVFVFIFILTETDAVKQNGPNHSWGEKLQICPVNGILNGLLMLLNSIDYLSSHDQFRMAVITRYRGVGKHVIAAGRCKTSNVHQVHGGPMHTSDTKTRERFEDAFSHYFCTIPTPRVPPAANYGMLVCKIPGLSDWTARSCIEEKERTNAAPSRFIYVHSIPINTQVFMYPTLKGTLVLTVETNTPILSLL